MEIYTFLLTIASIIIPVLVTIFMSIYTVENRVKAEHKPYLVLDSIQSINNIDKIYYFITMLGNKIRKKYSKDEIKDMIESNQEINVKIKLKNIGYGVATNIRFYDLNTGKKIYGNQEVTMNAEQQLFTTFDIAIQEVKSVQTSLLIAKTNNQIIEDTIITLCMYQDLNGNIYSFVFVINIKSGGGYSYYAYQPSSHSYNELIDKYKKQKKQIFVDYKK